MKSSSLLLLSAGRRYEPILVETAIPCDDDKAHWQSSSLQSPPSSWQTLSTTATLFQLALTSAMVGCVATLVGLATLDARVVTIANNGCLIFALVWSGLTALTAYLVFERLVGKSKAATAAVAAATDETMTYRLLSDEPNDDVTTQCEHELPPPPPPPQPCHAEDEQQQQHDSRTSTVFVWGTYVSFSVTCLLHDIVTTTTPMHSVSLPHYWLYGAVTVLTILTGASVIALPQRTTTTTTSTMDSGDFGGSSHFGKQASAGDNPHTNRMSLCAPETV
jgi:hypothetical protein